eukprot:2809646-Lingulodinium_polyedra.AAC.1
MRCRLAAVLGRQRGACRRQDVPRQPRRPHSGAQRPALRTARGPHLPHDRLVLRRGVPALGALHQALLEGGP